MAPKNKDPTFTNFTIKVNIDGSWEKTVKKMLKSVKGVSSFRMENDGRINISGTVDPYVLLESFRKSGKAAQIMHWQYGECSSNLYDKKKPSSSYGQGSSNYYYGDGYGYNNNGYDYNGYHNNGYHNNGYGNDYTGDKGYDPSAGCSIM